jgi:hypothetical protein
MTEETQVTETKVEAPPPEAKVEAEKPKPPGYDPVDWDAIGLTPEQKAVVDARTRYLYHQVRAGKEERSEFRKHNDELQARLEALEKDKVENTKTAITQAIKQARDEGRVEDELKLVGQLNSLDKPKEEKPKVNEEWWKTSAERWAVETSETGELKRPWIVPNHPDNPKATGLLFKIKERWEQEGRALNESTLPFLLMELDQNMQKPGGPKTPAVLGTSQTKGPAPKETELTGEEKYFADRTMSHIKDPADRYKRYAAQKALMRKK